MLKPKIGQVFGRLTVTQVLSNTNHRGWVAWCNCQCGNTIRVQASKLARGATKSCGCLRKETGDAFVRNFRQSMSGRGPIARRNSYARNDDIDDFLGGG